MDLNIPTAKKLSAKDRVSLVSSPIWVSVSEAASLGGVTQKTIRRAIKLDQKLQYRIVKNRYQIELGSLIKLLQKNTKLKNKLQTYGLGQYVKDWLL